MGDFGVLGDDGHGFGHGILDAVLGGFDDGFEFGFEFGRDIRVHGFHFFAEGGELFCDGSDFGDGGFCGCWVGDGFHDGGEVVLEFGDLFGGGFGSVDGGWGFGWGFGLGFLRFAGWKDDEERGGEDGGG